MTGPKISPQKQSLPGTLTSSSTRPTATDIRRYVLSLLSIYFDLKCLTTSLPLVDHRKVRGRIHDPQHWLHVLGPHLRRSCKHSVCLGVSPPPFGILGLRKACLVRIGRIFGIRPSRMQVLYSNRRRWQIQGSYAHFGPYRC